MSLFAEPDLALLIETSTFNLTNDPLLSHNIPMIERHLKKKLLKLAKTFPVVTITGPRQSGKTTLVRWLFRSHDYVSLEDPDEREFAVSDPRGFLRRFRKGLILDEVQRTPDLLSYIQTMVDREGRAGRFILTGSNQFHLMNRISQSLAGRSGIVHLLPFSLRELTSVALTDPYRLGFRCKKTEMSLEDTLFRGFYPPIHDRDIPPHDWLSAYYKSYVERDVREIVNIGNLDSFQRFIRLCAGRVGQLLNLSSLASDAGISHTTARAWMSLLQAGFITYTLQPHHTNFSKRIIKTPKLYFYDTGLLCYLLRIRSPGDILAHPMRGQIFENFVVTEILKAFANSGEAPPLYFWRDRTGHEVDLLVDTGNELIPVEIKSGETVSDDFFRGLRFFTGLGRPAAQEGFLFYGGDSLYKRGSFMVRPWYCC